MGERRNAITAPALFRDVFVQVEPAATGERFGRDAADAAIIEPVNGRELLAQGYFGRMLFEPLRSTGRYFFRQN